MNNKAKLISLLAMVSLGFGLATEAVVKNANDTAVKKSQTVPIASVQTCETVKSLDVVANPKKYLNKKIRIRAIFDKFSTLGLDYKPAFKSSEEYITFLIKRDDVINHTVPLSEMKNFLKRKVAEKYIDLKAGDLIEYSGTVFSNALGDVWIDVEEFKVLKQKKDKKTSTKK